MGEGLVMKKVFSMILALCFCVYLINNIGGIYMYKAVIVEDEPWSLMNIKTIFPWQNYNFEQPTGFDGRGISYEKSV